MGKTKGKSAAQKAAGAAKAAEMKKLGLGIFAPKKLSPALSKICGGKTSMARTDVTKAMWAYIKKNNLNKGREITPDATLKGVIPEKMIDMLQMAKYVSAHLS